jgi:hypothetical protein
LPNRRPPAAAGAALQEFAAVLIRAKYLSPERVPVASVWKSIVCKYPRSAHSGSRR